MDSISRQAAITLPVMPKEHRGYQTFNLDDAYEQGWNDLQKCIEALPSTQPERRWETCFDCPLSHGCPKIKGCTNEQAMEYAGEAPDDCPLSIQPEPHWIPCSERLPEIKKDSASELCIVYCDNGVFTFSELAEDLFGNVVWDCEFDKRVGKVIAWMPLPKPYKKEGEW